VGGAPAAAAAVIAGIPVGGGDLRTVSSYIKKNMEKHEINDK
jgi:hypothetical protein